MVDICSSHAMASDRVHVALLSGRAVAVSASREQPLKHGCMPKESCRPAGGSCEIQKGESSITRRWAKSVWVQMF